jgi:hypothetical protein
MSLVGSMVSTPLIEIATQIIHQAMDRQYREMFDQPVGMLNEQTPQQVAKTANGRKMVAEWLKFLENTSGRKLDPNDPMATYDFSWLWAELGVGKLRK